jgi:dephospho-CoA kinase
MKARYIPRLGITGGIGSGKSTALAYLRELGAAVISSDDIVHSLLRRSDMVEAIAAHFGDELVREGETDRQALARLVFRDEAALRWLEHVLHPAVKQAIAEWALAQEQSPRPPALLAAEVPLLFETEMQDVFTYVLLVTAPDALRRQRSEAKITDSEFSRRARLQMSEEEKARRSDFVFDNTGSRRDMKEFVAETYAYVVTADASAEADREP